MPVLRRETAALQKNHERAVLLDGAQETVLAGAGASGRREAASDARFAARVSSARRESRRFSGYAGGRSRPEPPPPSGMIMPGVPLWFAPKSDESPSLVAADPFSYEADLAPQTPLWAPQIVPDHEVEAPAPMSGFIPRLYDAATAMADGSPGGAGAERSGDARTGLDTAALEGSLDHGTCWRRESRRFRSNPTL